MKKVAFLLLLIINGICGFSQEFSYIPYNIQGADSTYFIKPFATSSPVQVAFDFTGFSTDSVTISYYYVFVNALGIKRLTLIENAVYPITLNKDYYKVVANGVTSNVYSFKLTAGFKGDQFAFKVAKHDAIVTDVLKVYIRK